MSSRRLLAIVALVVIVAGVALALLIQRDCDKAESLEQTTAFNGIEVEYRGEEYCEVIVDFGDVLRSSIISKTIRLTNHSDYPIVLLDYTTQCRCMWLEFERKPLASNETTDIILTFDSRGEWGSVGNYMEITTSAEGAPIVMWIGAEIE